MSDPISNLAAITKRLEKLEAESACRACLSDYMDMCDRLDANSDLNALGDLFTQEAVWGGKGARYEKDFGQYHGRAAIIDLMKKFCTTPAHFAMNAHFLSSEAITHNDNGSITGRWLMLQTPTFHNGESFLIAARLLIDFALEQASWRMARFSTENLYARKVTNWNTPIDIPQPTVAGSDC